jgi:hypothetical protein
VTTTLTRRIERLERALSPRAPGSCFVLVSDANAVEHEIARLKGEFRERLPVMTLADRKDRGH